MKENTLEIFTPDFSTKVELPLATDTVQAGFPSPAENHMDKPLDLNELMIKHPASTFIARAKGDSMSGDGIASGDLLIVDKAAEILNGCLAVCILDGDFTLKRLELHSDHAYLVPSNENYDPIYVNGETEFSVWGVVHWVIKKM